MLAKENVSHEKHYLENSREICGGAWNFVVGYTNIFDSVDHQKMRSTRQAWSTVVSKLVNPDVFVKAG